MTFKYSFKTYLLVRTMIKHCIYCFLVSIYNNNNNNNQNLAMTKLIEEAQSLSSRLPNIYIYIYVCVFIYIPVID